MQSGEGKDVSPAPASVGANTDATAILRLLREHVVHVRVPVLRPQEPRQAAAVAGRSRHSDAETCQPVALAPVLSGQWRCRCCRGSCWCCIGRRASCSHWIWKKGKETEKEREMCVLPLACCRCTDLLQALLAAVGVVGAGRARAARHGNRDASCARA